MTDATYLLAELEAAESWHFWFQARRRLVNWLRWRYFPNARRLLDVGCGTGFILEGLRDTSGIGLFGCDRQTQPLVVARRRESGARFFQAEADRLPAHQTFDLILALDVIEHIDDDVAALGGMFEALRPGGGLLLAVPQHPRLWSAVDDFSHHRRRYTRTELDRKVTAAGFEIVRRTSLFMTTLPLLLLSRRRGPANFDPSREFRVPRWLNWVLDRVLQVEEIAIRAGISLPVGGSLVIVARRRKRSELRVSDDRHSTDELLGGRETTEAARDLVNEKGGPSTIVCETLAGALGLPVVADSNEVTRW